MLVQPVKIESRQFQFRLNLRNAEKQMTGYQRSGDGVRDIRADFSRDDVQKEFLLQLEQVRFELALLALFFGNGDFVRLILSFFKLPDYWFVCFLLLLPGPNKT